MNMEEQDKQEKLDGNGDSVTTKDVTVVARRRSTKRRTGKETSTKPRKSHMESFLRDCFQKGMVEVLKRARSFLDGRGASLKRTETT